jgi:predicted RNase H-like HicB family nuclease
MSRHSVIVRWSEEDQAFIATVPELPGLSAFGDTQEEALRELDIAKGAFLEVMREDGEFAP